MSNIDKHIDKQALREAAEKAISEEGETWWNEEQLASDYGLALHRADAKFIAAANPATMLALLDELEAVQKTSAARLGAIDTTHKMFQRERDRADAAEKRSAELSQKADIYDMLRQDYELHGGLVEFVDWQAKRITELEREKVAMEAVMQAMRDEIRAAAGKGDAS
ncbi:ead/Ea22-like family protein [Enterobacter cloacae complex sp. P47BA]|uniref:ead/Ea22-like family protein n=1 Tax=Enterobacter cloacae complex sp. P47BA TaxID=2779540 RepID=UPI001D0457B8|nr:ead/Ea22-like family protein [Enterobacter cloacae complex sp. P47BA]